MQKTWIILTISVTVLLIAFVSFIFPGYYFTYESKKAASTTTGMPPPPSSSTPIFSTGGPTPIPSGSYTSYPSGSQTGSAGPSTSSSGSLGPTSSVSGSGGTSPGQSNYGTEDGGIFGNLYNKEIREGEIKNLSTNIVNPVIGVAAAATIAAFVLNPLLSLLFNFPFRDIFYFLFSSFLEFLGIKKRRRPWGVVYESISKKPIAGAVVKISETESGRVREMRITDDEGRFGFLVEKGIYNLIVVKNGFAYPSKKITLNQKGSDGYYPKVYLGGDIKVKEGFLGLNIPIDMIAEEPQKGRLLFLRIVKFFERIRLPLLIFGTILSLINLYLFRSIVDLIIVFIYISLWLFELLQLRKVKPYGEIMGENNTPQDLAVIRFFKEENSRLVSTTISDSHGRFYVLLPQGKFYLTVMKGGYLPYKSETINISKIGNPPEIKISLKKAI